MDTWSLVMFRGVWHLDPLCPCSWLPADTWLDWDIGSLEVSCLFHPSCIFMFCTSLIFCSLLSLIAQFLSIIKALKQSCHLSNHQVFSTHTRGTHVPNRNHLYCVCCIIILIIIHFRYIANFKICVYKVLQRNNKIKQTMETNYRKFTGIEMFKFNIINVIKLI